MVSETITIKVSNDIAELDRLKDEARDFCFSLGLPKRSIFQVLCALEEIFVNIVSYAYCDKDEHIIEIVLTHQRDKLELRIIDDGVEFNPLEVSEPDIELPVEDREIGGLGLHLTKNMMNDFNYDRCDGKNLLTLSKSLGNEK